MRRRNELARKRYYRGEGMKKKGVLYLIWIVSYFDDAHNGSITVTAFNNYDAAYRMYKYEYGKHYTVSIDEIDKLYSNYEVNIWGQVERRASM